MRAGLPIGLTRVPRGLAAALLLAALWPSAASGDAVRIGATGSAAATLARLGEAFHGQTPQHTVVVVPGLGSRGAKKALGAGAIDVAFVAEPLDAAERQQGLLEHEIARTPFVFAVGPRATVSSLTLEQLVEAFAGRMASWPDGERVRLVLRPAGDSDTKLLVQISPRMAEAVALARTRPGLTVAATDQEAATAIEEIPGALGTSTLALIVSERRGIRPLALGGVRPTPQAIADGAYPFSKPLLAVSRPGLAPAAEQFLAFVRSRAGRESLAAAGYAVR